MPLKIYFLVLFCLHFNFQFCIATPRDYRYGYPTGYSPAGLTTGSSGNLRRADDFLYNRAVSYLPSYPYTTQNVANYALSSPYLQYAYQDPYLNALSSMNGYQQALPQYYLAGLPPSQPTSTGLLARPVSRLATGLSGVLDVISAGIVERKLRRLPPYYFYPPPPPPPPEYYQPRYPNSIQDELAIQDEEDGKGKASESKKNEEKAKDEDKKEDTSEKDAITGSLSNQYLKSWPKIFTIMGSGVDGFIGGVDATRKEIGKMAGQIMSNGILMGGTVVHDVTSGVAQVIEKIADL